MGTKEILKILKSFADAHGRLKKNLVSAAFEQSKTSTSLLGSILGANYESYESQRQKLYEVFRNDPIFAQFWQPPPPADSPPPASPPPPPPPEETNGRVTKKGNSTIDLSKLSKKQMNSYERANRLRLLRTDIKVVPDLVTVEQAVELGGYASVSELDRDLSAREKAMAGGKGKSKAGGSS